MGQVRTVKVCRRNKISYILWHASFRSHICRLLRVWEPLPAVELYNNFFSNLENLIKAINSSLLNVTESVSEHSNSPRSSLTVEQRQEGRWWYPSWQTWPRWTRSNQTQTGHRSQSVPTYSKRCTVGGVKIGQNVLKSQWLPDERTHDFESSVLL